MFHISDARLNPNLSALKIDCLLTVISSYDHIFFFLILTQYSFPKESLIAWTPILSIYINGHTVLHRHTYTHKKRKIQIRWETQSLL